MGRTLIYKSDTGCRKGCHPVNIVTTYRGKRKEEHYFSVDEPGAWFEDKWNCHADGMDFPCDTREEAIRKGAEILYLQAFHGDPGIQITYEN